MNSKKEVQHVYLVGAKSLGAYGGYETFVYKLTEYHQNGKNMLQIKRGGCEDYISAESLVECIHGLPVKSIEFFTAENHRKEA